MAASFTTRVGLPKAASKSKPAHPGPRLTGSCTMRPPCTGAGTPIETTSHSQPAASLRTPATVVSAVRAGPDSNFRGSSCPVTSSFTWEPPTSTTSTRCTAPSCRSGRRAEPADGKPGARSPGTHVQLRQFGPTRRGRTSLTEQGNSETPAPGEVSERLEQALFEIRRVIAGQEQMLERVLVCLLAQGHLLIEGVPGLAKTLTIKTAAGVLGGSFARVQFTPDLVPSDLVGTRVYRAGDGRFDTELGPVFCNFLLADEINRAPAKVQSALLEVMQERQVTIGHTTHKVPEPFLVLATQNPIESEGTYPLPEAQIDRFMLKVLVDYPAHDEELTVVSRSLQPPPNLQQVLSIDELRALQAQARDVFVDPALISWTVDVATATRRPLDHHLRDYADYIAFGA